MPVHLVILTPISCVPVSLSWPVPLLKFQLFSLMYVYILACMFIRYPRVVDVLESEFITFVAGKILGCI